MRSYLDLLEDIYMYGNPKHPTRAATGPTRNGTIGLANLHFSHNLADGFPLLTTRQLPAKGIIGELRSFLAGDSNVRDFKANGCHFWDPWARPDGSLGPVYGVQWNRHNQMSHILKALRDHPGDRRLVASAWRPDEHEDMVLPPCHLLFVVTPYAGELNLAWIQRSCDFPIGVPCNIASYALLAHLLAAWAGLRPGKIDAIFCDAHIYDNQLGGVREQLKRQPQALPKINVTLPDRDDFSSWQADIQGWTPQPNINFGELEV